MSKEFEEWYDMASLTGLIAYDESGQVYSDTKKAWEAASEKEKRFGCWMNESVIAIYVFCVYDKGKKCPIHTSKTDCPHWRPIDS